MDRRHRAHRREIMRLVKRRQRTERLELGHQGLVDYAGCGMVHASVHDPMADRGQLLTREVTNQPAAQFLEQGCMRQCLSLGPVLTMKQRPVSRTHAHERADPDLLDLSAGDLARVCGVLERERGELDAR